jgi:hypothetical protein
MMRLVKRRILIPCFVDLDELIMMHSSVKSLVSKTNTKKKKGENKQHNKNKMSSKQQVNNESSDKTGRNTRMFKRVWNLLATIMTRRKRNFIEEVVEEKDVVSVDSCTTFTEQQAQEPRQLQLENINDYSNSIIPLANINENVLESISEEVEEEEVVYVDSCTTFTKPQAQEPTQLQLENINDYYNSIIPLANINENVLKSISPRTLVQSIRSAQLENINDYYNSIIPLANINENVLKSISPRILVQSIRSAQSKRNLCF